MNQTQVHISWDSYLNDVSKEFTFLQQNAEFVDLTLAAEGHLVKVHKNIVAIASPYIKAMLQSTPCQHPVIFLNNISHKILSYILEYIYNGEVNIPPDIIDKFIEACRSLCIRGVDGIAAPKFTPEKQSEPQDKGIDKPTDNNFAACITINNIDNNYDLQVVSNENNIKSQVNDNPLPLPLPVPAISVPVVEYKIPTSHVEDLGTECEGDIDINSINHFIIQKPKTSSNSTELKTINPDKAIVKLSETIIVPKHMPSILDSSLVKINTNTRDEFVNITLHNNGWQIQQPSETESRYTPIQHPVNVTFNTNNYEDNPNESSSVTHGDPVESNGYSQLTRKIVNKRISKFGAHAKDTKATKNKFNRIEMDKKPHYTISTRGSLQLLLNRFLYHSHHHSNGGRKRRWRCINYRKMHCPACIDTDDDEIVAVSESHCHPDHDIQIRKKIKSNKIFTSLTAAVNTIEDDLMKRHSKMSQSDRYRDT